MLRPSTHFFFFGFYHYLKTKKSWTKKGDTWTPTRVETKKHGLSLATREAGARSEPNCPGEEPPTDPFGGKLPPKPGC